MPGVPAFAIEEIDYPESDGQPVAETQSHFDELVDEVKQLETYFRDEPDVWVAGNLLRTSGAVTAALRLPPRAGTCGAASSRRRVPPR